MVEFNASCYKLYHHKRIRISFLSHYQLGIGNAMISKSLETIGPVGFNGVG